MTIPPLPWLELAILLSLFGSLCVGCFREPARAFHWGLGFTGAVLFCALMAWLNFSFDGPPSPGPWTMQPFLFGSIVFAIDQLSAPLLALVALLHFLTALATGR